VTKDSCSEFLRSALPRIGLRWAGFRRVRRQVCRRIGQRLRELRLADCAAYRRYLDEHPAEWTVLDSCCRIPISRFFRDRAVFDALSETILPGLAAQAARRGRPVLRAWSVGCAAGEEPYSLVLLWRLSMAGKCPGVELQILATDVEPHQLERAQTACYRTSSLEEVPHPWLEEAFVRSGALLCLKPEFREPVTFERQDVREAMPPGPFDLILCRNLAFTYFADAEQSAILEQLLERLAPGGAFIIGLREKLPAASLRLAPWGAVPGVFRRAET
jgi:chemotaxis protein methyltransferase CheR